MVQGIWRSFIALAVAACTTGTPEPLARDEPEPDDATLAEATGRDARRMVACGISTDTATIHLLRAAQTLAERPGADPLAIIQARQDAGMAQPGELPTPAECAELGNMADISLTWWHERGADQPR